jgi:uncharacterized protein
MIRNSLGLEMDYATPAEGAQRLELLDALRGFALAGVLLVNLRDLSLFGFLNEEARAELPTAGWDHFLAMVIAAFVDVKALTIFTLLFGIGFAIQAQRAAESEHGMQYYIRRLLILLAIGILHGLFWYGDVLRFYALMGLLLVPMKRLNSSTLLCIGLLLSLVPWRLLQPIVDSLRSSSNPQEVMLMWAFAAFSSPSLPRMLQANLSYDLWLKGVQWSLPLAIFGRFVLGAAIGRTAVLRDPRVHSYLWKGLFIFTLPVGVALTVLIVIHDYQALSAMRAWLNSEMIEKVVQIFRGTATLSLALAYVAGFVLLFQRAAWHRWLNLLAPVGRMALTNYLFQTFVGMGLFYGIGLGIGPRFGLVGVTVFFLLIFSAQIAISHWWLACFNFGPLEWIWRSLTYGRRLQLRRAVAK